MNSVAFTRYELLRLVRNRRAFIFSLIFPLILFLVIGTSAKGDAYGVPYKEYYMVAMIAFGATMAVLSGGARIATDRAAGWMRALRLTPLSVRAYLRAKMASGLFLALISVVLISAAGLATGVRMGWGPWLETVALVVVGLLPLGLVGITLGHLGTPESMGPIVGGLSALLSMLGGSWFPLSGTLESVGKLLPTYWITRAGPLAIQGHAWPGTAWVVVVAWTAGAAVLAAWAYRRSEGRR